jgi:putative addiction module killer protein
LGYFIDVVKLRTTEAFVKWLDRLSDSRARDRILARIKRLETGNPGDFKAVREGVLELRIDYGPGYRVYYKMMSQDAAVLLLGGTKQKQQSTIETALQLARDL